MKTYMSLLVLGIVGCGTTINEFPVMNNPDANTDTSCDSSIPVVDAGHTSMMSDVGYALMDASMVIMDAAMNISMDATVNASMDAGTMDAHVSDSGMMGSMDSGVITTMDSGIPVCPYLYFNGTDTMVSVAPNTLFQLGYSDFTIETLVKPTNVNGQNNTWFLGHDDGAGSHFKWMLGYGNQGAPTITDRGMFFAFTSDNRGYRVVWGNFAVSDNEWYHVAATRHGNVMSVWVNGNLIAQDQTWNNIIDDANGAVTFGTAEPPYFYQGMMRDISISRVSRYNAPFIPTTPMNDSDTTGLWHMDEGSGTAVMDSSNNHFNGTTMNASWQYDVCR